MKFILTYSGVVALVILAIVGGMSVFNVKQSLLGSTSCANITCLSGGLRLVSDAGGDFESDVAAVFNSTAQFLGGFQTGANGTNLTEIKSGTCTLWSNATTIVASSTQTVECTGATNGTLSAIAGIQSGDRVFVNLASTTVATFQGLSVQWSAASTTPGGIMIKIFNGTGATFTWASTASSSIQYSLFR